MPLGKPQVQAVTDSERPPNIGDHSYVNVTRDGVPIRDYVNLQSNINSGGEWVWHHVEAGNGGRCSRGVQLFWGSFHLSIYVSPLPWPYLLYGLLRSSSLILSPLPLSPLRGSLGAHMATS